MNRWSPRSQLVKGFLLLGLGLGGFAAWAATAEIDGAVVRGRVGVEARNQSVQHPDGGLIAEIFVREGDLVEKGAPLLRLDGADLQARRAIALRPLYETLAGLDRRLAETRGEARPAWREELRAVARTDAAIAAMLAEEAASFHERRAALDQTLAQSAARRRESEALVEGRRRQLQAKQEQLRSLHVDLERKSQLRDRGFGTLEPVMALQRAISEAIGDVGELEAGVVQARNAAAGSDAEAARARSEWLEAARRGLRELQPREAELREQLRLIDVKIERLSLRAPMAGRILGLKVHTEGGVIGAGAEVAALVPADAPLALLVEVDPLNVDRIHVGQAAILRFPNFNARTTPELPGRVDKLSADVMTEPGTGRRYFSAELSLAPEGLAALGGQTLSPGMPVEAFIRTESRSPASFLLKPLTDYMAYAMREK